MELTRELPLWITPDLGNIVESSCDVGGLSVPSNTDVKQ